MERVTENAPGGGAALGNREVGGGGEGNIAADRLGPLN